MDSVIFAPHIDDEMIGCYCALTAGLISKVVYFFDQTEERLQEARAVAARYQFEVVSGSLEKPISTYLAPEDTLYLPHIKDVHLHHKRVNSYGQKHPGPKLYYSIDMTANAEPLPYDVAQAKLAELKESYPSQVSIFDDEKYAIFEALNNSTLTSSRTLSFGHEDFSIEVTTSDPIDLGLVTPPRGLNQEETAVWVMHKLQTELALNQRISVRVASGAVWYRLNYEY